MRWREKHESWEGRKGAGDGWKEKQGGQRDQGGEKSQRGWTLHGVRGESA